VADVTKTIGTSSRDYSTITAWEAAIDNTTYPDASTRAVGECYNDSAFDEAFTINAAPSNVTSITLSVASGQRHDGTAGTGARIVTTAQRAWLLDSPTLSNKVIEWLDFNCNSTASKLTLDDNGVGDHIRRILFRKYSGNGMNWLVARSGNGGDYSFSNSLVYDCVAVSTGDHAWALGDTVTSRSFHLYNITAYNIRNTTGGSSRHCSAIYVPDIANTLKNVIAMGTQAPNGTATDFQYLGTTPVDANCMSSDATGDDGGGSGNLINKVATNQFVSTTTGSEDLHLKSGADAINAGVDLVTTPTGVNFDIDNRDRDAEGDTWDIGADEFVAAVVAAAQFKYLPSLGVG